MSTQILVATADPAFGEALRAGLAEEGGYDVHLVHSGSEVLNRAALHPYAVAILDAELRGEPFVPLARRLRAQLPGVRLMIIPPANPEDSADLSALAPYGTVGRPFYLLEVVETVRELLSLHSEPVSNEPLAAPLEKTSGPKISWAEDPAQAGDQLQRMLQETNAQAAWIAFEGKSWAAAGRLGSQAVQEAAQMLGTGGESGSSTDLARYARIEATGSEHLIYVTRLLDELVLGMVYEAEAPLTRVHAQAARLAAALSSLAIVPTSEEAPPTLPLLPTTGEGEVEDLYGEEGPAIDLSVLLAGMPPPDPDGKPLFSDSGWIHEMGSDPSEEDFLLPWERQVPAPGNGKAAPEKAQELDWFNVFRAGIESSSPGLASQDSGEPKRLSDHEQAAELSDEIPIDSLTPLVPADPLFRAGAAFGDLLYTCILLPRKADHFLTGELAEKLGLWIPQLCLAFGWRLEGLTIRPEYVQCVLRMAPGMSSGNVINIIRQRTSERIYNEFQELQKLEGPGDFWAPGYLMVRGSQTPTAEQLNNFIQQARGRQGLSEE